MTQPKTDLAYLRSEKAKAEQQLRYLPAPGENSGTPDVGADPERARVHRLCTRAGMLESFLICAGRTDQRSGDGAAENLRSVSRKLCWHLQRWCMTLHERSNVQNP